MNESKTPRTDSAVLTQDLGQRLINVVHESKAMELELATLQPRIERLMKAGDELDEAILSRVEYAVTPKQKIDSANRIIVARHAWQEAKK